MIGFQCHLRDRRRQNVETLIGLLFVGLIVYLIFQGGKRLGSRKGYGVGREHGRKGM